MSNPDAARIAPDLVPGLLEAARIAEGRVPVLARHLGRCSFWGTRAATTARMTEASQIAAHLRAKAKEITDANR